MKKGLFIGLTTVDVQYFVTEHPGPNTKMKTTPPTVAAGGPAANAAIAFAYLGGRADFLTCVGKNDFQSLIHNDYKKHNVHLIDGVQGTPFNPVVSTVITNTTNSDRTIVTYNPELPYLHFDFDSVDVANYEFVFTDGFYPELAIPLCRKAREMGIPVIFDGGSWKPHLPSILPLLDVAICSNNYMPPGCNSKKEAMDYTQKEGVGHVAISRGQKTILAGEKEINVPQVEAVDSLGAGDILHGAFCWYWKNQSLDFIEALKAASVIASNSVKYKGTRSWMNK